MTIRLIQIIFHVLTILGREEYNEVYIIVHGKKEKFETTAIRKLLKIGCEEVNLSPTPSTEDDVNDQIYEPNISKCIFKHGKTFVRLAFDGDDRY